MLNGVESIQDPPSEILYELLAKNLVPETCTNEDVERVLPGLPYLMRSLLRYIYIQDLLPKEAAALLQIDETSALNFLNQALAFLAQRLLPEPPVSAREQALTLLNTIGSYNVYVLVLLTMLIENNGLPMTADAILTYFQKSFPKKDRIYLLSKLSHSRSILNKHFPRLLKIKRNNPKGPIQQIAINLKKLEEYMPVPREDRLPMLEAHEQRANALIASGASVKNMTYRTRSHPGSTTLMGLLLLEEGAWIHRARLYPAFSERMGEACVNGTVYGQINHARKSLHENFPGLLEEEFGEETQIKIPTRLRIQPERFEYYLDHGNRLASQMLESKGVSDEDMKAVLSTLIMANGRWMDRETFFTQLRSQAADRIRDPNLYSWNARQKLNLLFPNLIQEHVSSGRTLSEIRLHPYRFRDYLQSENLPIHEPPWIPKEETVPLGNAIKDCTKLVESRARRRISFYDIQILVRLRLAQGKWVSRKKLFADFAQANGKESLTPNLDVQMRQVRRRLTENFPDLIHEETGNGGILARMRLDIESFEQCLRDIRQGKEPHQDDAALG